MPLLNFVLSFEPVVLPIATIGLLTRTLRKRAIVLRHWAPTLLQHHLSQALGHVGSPNFLLLLRQVAGVKLWIEIVFALDPNEAVPLGDNSDVYRPAHGFRWLRYPFL